MTERTKILIEVERQMHDHLASTNDIAEVIEKTMVALDFTDVEKILVRMGRYDENQLACL